MYNLLGSSILGGAIIGLATGYLLEEKDCNLPSLVKIVTVGKGNVQYGDWDETIPAIGDIISSMTEEVPEGSGDGEFEFLELD